MENIVCFFWGFTLGFLVCLVLILIVLHGVDKQAEQDENLLKHWEKSMQDLANKYPVEDKPNDITTDTKQN
jgi:hypothetical protein